MKAVVSNSIKIEYFTHEFYQMIKEQLVFPNPEYYKKVERGQWVGNTPREIVLFEKDGCDLYIPFGMLPFVFKHKDMFETIINKTQTDLLLGFCVSSNIKPYEYQEKAIKEALRAKQGVIVAPCGSGKTQIGLEIIKRLKLKALWLTHTTDLLNQSLERAKSVFNAPDSWYGTITSGKVNIGNWITFATVQTMSKLKLEDYKDRFDVVVVDEAHHIVGTPTRVQMFYKVISSINARYKFGLTATPKRADGLSKCMFALLGEKIYEITKDDVKENTVPVNVFVEKTHYEPDFDKILMPDGTVSYVNLITDLTEDHDRNELIIGDAMICEQAKKSCLILTDRISHIEYLMKRFCSMGIKAIGLVAKSSKTGKKERKTAINKINTKEVRILISTYALAKEGLDIPTLNTVILATPKKDETTVIQACGRVERKADIKLFGSIIDYEDNFSMLKNWQKKRISIYKKNGYSVMSC